MWRTALVLALLSCGSVAAQSAGLPETKPFVEVGSMVKVGDKLLLVEAMKTFNDIVATRAGRVVSILVEDGSPVEYDQPLMIVE